MGGDDESDTTVDSWTGDVFDTGSTGWVVPEAEASVATLSSDNFVASHT